MRIHPWFSWIFIASTLLASMFLLLVDFQLGHLYYFQEIICWLWGFNSYSMGIIRFLGHAIDYMVISHFSLSYTGSRADWNLQSCNHAASEFYYRQGNDVLLVQFWKYVSMLKEKIYDMFLSNILVSFIFRYYHIHFYNATVKMCTLYFII